MTEDVRENDDHHERNHADDDHLCHPADYAHDCGDRSNYACQHGSRSPDQGGVHNGSWLGAP